MSVYDADSPKLDSSILKLGIPILGICYGLQIICKEFNGNVEPASSREYGKASLQTLDDSILLKEVKKESIVWMSHGDYLTKIPDDFEIIGKSDHSPICAISNTKKDIYGVQFHPEVNHTEEGRKILNNFLFKICKCKGDWTSKNFIEESIEKIRETVKGENVICALSGGVDSTVAAVLVEKSIGDKLLCIHIDTGLMRKNESHLIQKMFAENLHLNFINIDSSDKFLNNLKGISEPEK